MKARPSRRTVPLRPCGTLAAYRRHLNRPEKYGAPCLDCLAEKAREARERRARDPERFNARRREIRNLEPDRERRRARAAIRAARAEALEALAHRHPQEFEALLQRALSEYGTE